MNDKEIKKFVYDYFCLILLLSKIYISCEKENQSSK